MNCLLQKAMRDKVMTNRCVMDSILWFHLECPKASSQFDDPNTFKLKFREFFAEVRTGMENYTSMSDEHSRMRKEYNKNFYPEDIREKMQVKQFEDQFTSLSPKYNPPDSEELQDKQSFWDETEIDQKKAAYGKRPDFAWPKPITRADSLKHRAA